MSSPTETFERDQMAAANEEAFAAARQLSAEAGSLMASKPGPVGVSFTETLMRMFVAGQTRFCRHVAEVGATTATTAWFPRMPMTIHCEPCAMRVYKRIDLHICDHCGGRADTLTGYFKMLPGEVIRKGNTIFSIPVVQIIGFLCDGCFHIESAQITGR